MDRPMHDLHAAPPVADAAPHGAAGSLTDDLVALFDDGKTYAQAELAFQKSRAGFVAGQSKSAAIYGLGALAFFHLALIALTVGAVLSLATVIGPLGATAVVTLVLLVLAAIMLVLLKGRAGEIRSAFAEDTHG